MPDSQAAVCVRMQEEEHLCLQVVAALSLFYISSTLDMHFRRLQSRQMVIQLGWDGGVNFVWSVRSLCVSCGRNIAGNHRLLSK